MAEAAAASFRLQRSIDPKRDHVRGGGAPSGVVNVVLYGDFLCPYCRRLRHVLLRLRQALGDRLAYVFRHYPNERAHPGAESIARASEAAGKQGRFWDMYDLIYKQDPPVTKEHAYAFARTL